MKISWEEALKFYNENSSKENGSVESLRQHYDGAKEVFIQNNRMFMRDITIPQSLTYSIVYASDEEFAKRKPKPWWRFW